MRQDIALAIERVIVAVTSGAELDLDIDSAGCTHDELQWRDVRPDLQGARHLSLDLTRRHIVVRVVRYSPRQRRTRPLTSCKGAGN